MKISCTAIIFNLSFCLVCQAKTLCDTVATERGYALDFESLNHIFEWPRSEVALSVEDLMYDGSAMNGGCPRYLNITGHMGTFVGAYSTYDIYSVALKDHRPLIGKTEPCNPIGLDWDQPPRMNIKEPGKASPEDSLGGFFCLLCYSG